MGLSVAQLVALSPPISYWTTSLFYETVSYFGLFPQYRVMPREDDNAPAKNQVSKRVVLRYMALHSLLATFGIFLVAEHVPMKSFAELPTFETTLMLKGFQSSALQNWGPLLLRICHLAARQLVTIIIMDGWLFWCHLAMHKNPWLYRECLALRLALNCTQHLTHKQITNQLCRDIGNIHCVHHKLYVPYSFGALYNHWAESLFQDDLGGVLSVTIVGLSDWEQVLFYAWTMAKSVEDHAGYELPFSPFVIMGRLTGSGVAYHNVHHQIWGHKVSGVATLKHSFIMY